MLEAPFPYFGGKLKIAELVWQKLGNVKHYIEPFFGSGAVLLARPDWHNWTDKIETANDIDGLVCNFWRAVKHAPEKVAEYADWPVIENDLHARHVWLQGQRESLRAKLEGDPEYYDAKAAGWWLWGACIWLGSRWCLSQGRWNVIVDKDNNKILVKTDNNDGVRRYRPHLTSYGMKIFSASMLTKWISEYLEVIIDNGVDIAEDWVAFKEKWSIAIHNYMIALQNRLRRVRITCTDWTSVLNEPLFHSGFRPVGVFLDPPYSVDIRTEGLYVQEENIAAKVRDWCIKNSNNPDIRIALCGYEGEHNILETEYGWSVVEWSAQGGYSYTGDSRGKYNKDLERVWFSPSCVKETISKQIPLL